MKAKFKSEAKLQAAIRRQANPFRKRAQIHPDRKKEAVRRACRNI